MTTTKTWTFETARALAAELERLLTPLGAHVALSGSCLYKGESDKDCDIFVYPHLTSEPTNAEELHKVFSTFFDTTELTRRMDDYFRNATKDQKYEASYFYKGKRVDIFFVGKTWLV